MDSNIYNDNRKATSDQDEPPSRRRFNVTLRQKAMLWVSTTCIVQPAYGIQTAKIRYPEDFIEFKSITT